jgi:flagellar biosynthetic protein FliQ
MNASDAVDLARNAIYVSLLISAPLLLVGMAVGLLIGLVQALTQIQDQTVSFVPKLVATVAALAFCLPWILQRLLDYSEDLFKNVPRMLLGG